MRNRLNPLRALLDSQEEIKSLLRQLIEKENTLAKNLKDLDDAIDKNPALEASLIDALASDKALLTSLKQQLAAGAAPQDLTPEVDKVLHHQDVLIAAIQGVKDADASP